MPASLIESILIDPSGKEAGLHLYNYSKESVAAHFYCEQFSHQTNKSGEMHDKDEETQAPRESVEAIEFFKTNLPRDAVIVELGGGRYQSRSGFPNRVFENYIPLDISYTSIRRYVEIHGRPGVVSDACALPFKDSSIDAFFTHTFLEHPTDPEQVLREIHRTLKPGGLAVHSDAWNCRWWQRHGVVGIKPFHLLTKKEALVWLAAQVTEFKPVRLPAIILRRLVRLLTTPRRHPIGLRRGKLRPNYDLHLYQDEDAASSIDPTDLMMFYESRCYRLIPQLSFPQKMFFRHPNVYVQKP